jgi:hypothetical protein
MLLPLLCCLELRELYKDHPIFIVRTGYCRKLHPLSFFFLDDSSLFHDTSNNRRCVKKTHKYQRATTGGNSCLLSLALQIERC